MKLRMQKVRELMLRELCAVLERHYRFEDCLVTVHDVLPTEDLRHCSVFVGVLGKPDKQEPAIAKLNRERGAIQRELYKRVKLRQSPQLIFRLDRTTEKAVPLIQVIDSLPAPFSDEPPAPL